MKKTDLIFTEQDHYSEQKSEPHQNEELYDFHINFRANFKNGMIYTTSWVAVTLFAFSLPIFRYYFSFFVIYLFTGIGIISMHYVLRVLMEQKVRRTFNYVIAFVKDKSKIADYTDDTEKWIAKIFNKDFSLFKKIMLGLGIFSISAVLIFGTYNIYSMLPELNNNFYQNVILLIRISSSNIFGIISVLFLLYYYIRINALLFGTSNIVHHFTFWDLDGDLNDSNFAPDYSTGHFELRWVFKRFSNNQDIDHMDQIDHIDHKDQIDYVSQNALLSGIKQDSSIRQKIFHQNPLGELIILNIFLFLIQTMFLANNFVGYILCAMIFIISPIKPTRDYSKYISKPYKMLLNIIPILFVITGIMQIYVTYTYHMSVISLIIQYTLMIFFYRTWWRFIKGTAVKAEEFRFNLKIIFERIAKWLNVNYTLLMVFLSLLPVIGYGLNLWYLSSIDHPIFYTNLVLLLCMAFFSMAMINLYRGIIYIRDKTREIAEIYYAHTREDKKTETKYHFWETFSSPQMALFAFVYAFIFAFWANWLVDGIMQKFPWVGISPLLKIPLGITFFLTGMGFGSVIWTFYHAVHFSWHSISLSTLTEEDLKNDENLLSPKPIYEQFRLIVLTSLPAVIFFGFGFYLFSNQPLIVYVVVFSFIGIFYTFMLYLYVKSLNKALDQKKQDILNQ